jgi:hypothetical protein
MSVYHSPTGHEILPAPRGPGRDTSRLVGDDTLSQLPL